MKRWMSFLLAIVMIASLAGCGLVQPKQASLSRGEIDGGVYTNNNLNIRFAKPESWVFSTDEEIAAVMNMAAENLLDENFKKALENNPSVYDMMVVDTVTRSNISVGYENLAKSYSSNITVEQYVEAMKRQFEKITEMTVTFSDKLETVKLGDTEFTRVVCSTTAYGTTMTQVYYLQKMNGYMGFVIATINNGYTVADIEAMFKAAV